MTGLNRISPVVWKSDLSEVVLEVPGENGKGSNDAEKCSIRQLLHEMEDSGVTDASLNCHEVMQPLSEVGGGDDMSMMMCSNTFQLITID